MFENIARYEEDGLGLPYPVVLVDSAEAEIDASGAMVGVSVPDMEGLACAVALVRCIDPLQLAGEEVRFIRHVLDLSGRELAQAMGMDHATLSRWENGKQLPGAWADKQVRFIALLQLADRVHGLHVDPKAAIPLQIIPRAAGKWPQIEMRRVSVGDNAGEAKIWDAPALAA